MTKEEYKTRLKDLGTDYFTKQGLLAKEYALSHNSYKVGDKFTDHIGTILISSVKYTKDGGSGFPCCVYEGLELKKDGTVTKTETRRTAWQQNDVKNDKSVI